MNYELLNIDWAPDMVAFHLGSYAVRWYSMCWCIGLATVYWLERRLFREQKVSDEKFDPLFLYCFLGILIGARLGHCIFYEPGYYMTSLKGIIETFLPIKLLEEGGWKFTGYEGLASHGGTAGLIIALWLYVRKTGLKFMFVLDDIAIVTPICACAIRIGNLMNSEIIGRVSDVPWAFRFMYSQEAWQTLGEDGLPLPRHPGQLYEALCYAAFFFIGWWFYRRSMSSEVKSEKLKVKNSINDVPSDKAWLKPGSGFYFGLCLTLIFTSRFFIEYLKEVQGGIDNGSMPIDMGQLLSIPFILIGAFFMWRAVKTANKTKG